MCQGCAWKVCLVTKRSQAFDVFFVVWVIMASSQHPAKGGSRYLSGKLSSLPAEPKEELWPLV